MTSNAANTVATSVGTGTLVNDLAATAADFAIGAEARNSSGNTGQFLGLIDEVRISGVARGPGDFIFAVPEASAFWLAAFSMVSSWVGFRRR